MFDLRDLPRGNDRAFLGDDTVTLVKAVGSLTLRFRTRSSLPFHADSTDLRVQLTDIHVVKGMKFNALSPLRVQQSQDAVLNSIVDYVLAARRDLHRSLPHVSPPHMAIAWRLQS